LLGPVAEGAIVPESGAVMPSADRSQPLERV
jgi:hypothetical protein